MLSKIKRHEKGLKRKTVANLLQLFDNPDDDRLFPEQGFLENFPIDQDGVLPLHDVLDVRFHLEEFGHFGQISEGEIKL